MEKRIKPNSDNRLRTPSDRLVGPSEIMRKWNLRFKRAYLMPKTRRLLNVIEENEYPTVEELANYNASSHSGTSQDLGLLKKIGLINFEAEGKFHGYFINKPKMKETIILAEVMRALEDVPCKNREHEEDIQAILSVLGHTKKIIWVDKHKDNV